MSHGLPPGTGPASVGHTDLQRFVAATFDKPEAAGQQTRSRQIQTVEAFVSTSSVNNSEGFFQL
jgi:hypothetical protein